MQNPELFACLSKERKENLLGTLLFRPSIYERLYYEEEMVRKQIVCYEEFLQIVRNPQIRAAAPEIDFEFEEFSANSYLSLVDEYLYWNKVPGDILLRLKKEKNLSFLFISHDLALVQAFCDRVLVMYQGEIVEEGKTEDVISRPKEPTPGS